MLGDWGVSPGAGGRTDQNKIPENNCAFCSTYLETLKRIVYLANLLLGIWPKKTVRNAKIHADEIFIGLLYIRGLLL